ncbi:MAG: tandem-95 repeat protein [Cocleimonas sp.]|nr:tandem-95 repeat protein [Cocleimonas sp.]
MQFRKINYLSFLLLLLAASILQATPSSVWQPVSQAQRTAEKTTLSFMPEKYSFFRLDENAMRRMLMRSAREVQSKRKEIEVPLPNGTLIQLALRENKLMEAGLAAKYPRIKTFKAQAINDPNLSGVVGISVLGFHGMLFTGKGQRIFIDTRHKNGNDYYISYYDKDYKPTEKKPFQCKRHGYEGNTPRLPHLMRRVAQRSGLTRRTYRIAIAATGEYTAVFGGTKTQGLAAIVTTLARVNEIYERDLSIHLTLVANNDQIIYTDAATDPFTNNQGTLLIDEAQKEMDAKIGSQNYDIGHTVSTDSGGLASLGVVCDDARKGEGVTGNSDPQNDAYDIDFVSHEIGHQFSAYHTFNSETASCGGGNRDTNFAYEAGSGSTIMGYTGICGVNDLQPNTDAMFHHKSIEQIGAFISNSKTGGACGVSSNNNNSAAPIVLAGSNYTIPARTPFALRGHASDANKGDTLSYSWEQNDVGTASDVNIDQGDNALFRVYLPKQTPVRHFPKQSDLLSGQISKGEKLPSTSRTLNFALAVRDQKGAVGVDTMKLTVNDTGSSFAITSHTDATLILTTNSSTTVTWEVASTNLPPINCSTVDILLSTDGGVTFSTLLSHHTENDGNETVNLPTLVENTRTRLKISCVDNIFFDISDVDLILKTKTISNNTPVSNNSRLSVITNTVTKGRLLASDKDTADTLRFSLVKTALKGVVVISNTKTGDFTYTPNTGAVGQDSFTFKVNDSKADSNTAIVTIIVVQNTRVKNTKPIAVDDVFEVLGETPITINNVLVNDSDSDGDTLSIIHFDVTSKEGGVVVRKKKATFIYTAPLNFSGVDSFTYTISDSKGGIATATVKIKVTSACFIATAAFGSYLNADVEVLRDFRDQYLLIHPLGKQMVTFYYRNAPPIAHYIAERESLRHISRWLLTPVIYAIKYPIAFLALLLIVLLLWKKHSLLMFR